MKVRNVAIAGAVSLAAAAALSSPAYAATMHHHPTPPPPPSHSRYDGCALSVSNPRPHPGDREVLTVQTDVGRTVVQVSYRGGRGWTLVTGGNGLAFGNFNVGDMPPHRTVTLVGEVVAAPRGYRDGATCYTNFTSR